MRASSADRSLYAPDAKPGAVLMPAMRKLPVVPIWNNYVSIGGSVPTFDDALIVKDGFLHMGACAF